MAIDKKISELPAATVPLSGTEKFEILQGGVNKQVDASDVGGGAALTDGNGTTANGSAADLGGTISGNTTLTLGGDFWLRILGIAATTPRFIIDGVNNTRRSLQFRTGGLPRWDLHIEGNETGANAAADFHFERYNDAGAFIDELISISRATGIMNFTIGPTVNGSGIIPGLVPAATTGTAVAFAVPQIYGTPGSPETGNITLTTTGLIVGVIQKMYHNSGTAPSFGAEFVRISGNYVESTLNIIHFEAYSTSRIEYTVTQEI